MYHPWQEHSFLAETYAAAMALGGRHEGSKKLILFDDNTPCEIGGCRLDTLNVVDYDYAKVSATFLNQDGEGFVFHSGAQAKVPDGGSYHDDRPGLAYTFGMNQQPRGAVFYPVGDRASTVVECNSFKPAIHAYFRAYPDGRIILFDNGGDKNSLPAATHLARKCMNQILPALAEFNPDQFPFSGLPGFKILSEIGKRKARSLNSPLSYKHSQLPLLHCEREF